MSLAYAWRFRLHNIAEAFTVTDPCNRMLVSWFMAVAVCAIALGSTMALVTVIHPGADFPIALSR